MKEEILENNETIIEENINEKENINKKQIEQEFGCTREIKNLIGYLEEAINKAPKKYRYFICNKMYECTNDIVHLINKCNGTPLDKETHGLSPSKKYKLKRLEYHRDIYVRILDFQHYLEICESFLTKTNASPIFTKNEIINMTKYLGRLKSLTKGWEDRDVERAKNFFVK